MVSMRLLLTSLILLGASLAVLPASAAPEPGLPDVRPYYCPEGQGTRVTVDGETVVDCTPPALWPCDGGSAVLGHCIQYERLIAPPRAGDDPVVEFRPCLEGEGTRSYVAGHQVTDCSPSLVERCPDGVSVAGQCVQVGIGAAPATPTAQPPLVELEQCAGRGTNVVLLGGKAETGCVYLVCDPACDATEATDAEAQYVRTYYCGTTGIGVVVMDRVDSGCIPVCTDYCKDGAVRAETTETAPVEVYTCWRGMGVRVLTFDTTCLPLGCDFSCKTTAAVQPVDAPASHGDPDTVERCGDQVAFKVTLHHAYESDCLGPNVYVWDCPGGVRVMVGDHPTGCLPVKPST